MAKVSILIPAYNQEELVGSAVESALAQTHANKEIVVADDASSDGTWSRVQKYRSRPEVKLFKNPHNLGRAGNHRHLLYDLACGDYAVMLDGDDYFVDKDFVAEAAAVAERHQLRLVFAEARGATFPFKEGVISYRDIFQNGALLLHGAALYRRDLALPYRFYFQNIIADDNEGFLRFIVGEPIGFLKRQVYVYRGDSRPGKYGLEERFKNDLMVESVYRHAVLTCPQDLKLFSAWRDKMRSTFFYGNLINLGHYGKFGQIFSYLTEYVQKRGVGGLLKALRHPLTAYRWGYQRS